MNTKEQLVSLYTIVCKEIERIMRIWTQTLLPSGITMTLYLVIFGLFIGSQVSDIQGVSYREFIVPGIIMMAVINNAFSNVVSSFFGSKFQKSIEELLVSPTSVNIIILGYVIGGMYRGLIVGIIVLLISLFFISISLYSLSITLAFILLTALVFSLMGLLNGMFAKRFDDVMIIPTFVLTPLTYLGGVFYSIDFLPEFWKLVSLFNPILYMVNGFRYGFSGISDIPVWTGLSLLLLLSAALYIANWIFLKKGVGLRG